MLCGAGSRRSAVPIHASLRVTMLPILPDCHLVLHHNGKSTRPETAYRLPFPLRVALGLRPSRVPLPVAPRRNDKAPPKRGRVSRGRCAYTTLARYLYSIGFWAPASVFVSTTSGSISSGRSSIAKHPSTKSSAACRRCRTNNRDAPVASAMSRCGMRAM